MIAEVDIFLLVVFVKLKLSLKTNRKQKHDDFFYKQSNVTRRFDAGVQLLTDAQRRLLVTVANKTISFI